MPCANARRGPIASQGWLWTTRQLFTLTRQMSDNILGAPMPTGNLEERARPRSVQVRDELTHRIGRGLLPAGSRPPSAPAPAPELGVSPAPLRGAFAAAGDADLV